MKHMLLCSILCLSGISIPHTILAATLPYTVVMEDIAKKTRDSWNRSADLILGNDDKTVATDLIKQKFEQWKKDEVWLAEFHLCCALALLKHADQDLGEVLGMGINIKRGLKNYLDICILGNYECDKPKQALGTQAQRTGVINYLISTGKLIREDLNRARVKGKGVSLFTKFIVREVYLARKLNYDFQTIVANKEIIFDKALNLMAAVTSYSKNISNEFISLYWSPKTLIHSTLWKPTPKDQYCVSVSFLH